MWLRLSLASERSFIFVVPSEFRKEQVDYQNNNSSKASISAYKKVINE
jgi:hypothetical protein